MRNEVCIDILCLVCDKWRILTIILISGNLTNKPKKLQIVTLKNIFIFNNQMKTNTTKQSSLYSLFRGSWLETKKKPDRIYLQRIKIKYVHDGRGEKII